MSFTREQVAQIYVATFNRAPDAAGLDYWVNNSGFTNIEDVASSFFDSEEATVMYPSGTSNTVMVEAAYQNLFGRDADANGLAYWVNELDAGNFSQSLMLQAIINGAQDTSEFGNDATMMANKTTVGLSFADAGLSDVDSALNIMANITDDNSTLEAAGLTISNMLVATSVESESNSVQNTSSYLDIGLGFEHWAVSADILENDYINTFDFSYNQESQILSSFNHDNGVLDSQFIFNSDNKVSQETRFENDGAIRETTVYQYNDNNQVSEVTYSNSDMETTLILDNTWSNDQLVSLYTTYVDGIATASYTMIGSSLNSREDAPGLYTLDENGDGVCDLSISTTFDEYGNAVSSTQDYHCDGVIDYQSQTEWVLLS